MDKELIRSAKIYRKNFKMEADRHEELAKENRNIQKICENLINKELHKRRARTNGN